MKKKNNNLISISGKAGVGKNTVANIIQRLCLSNNGNMYIQKSFGYKIKQIASILLNIPIEKFEEQDFKKTLLGEEWGTIKENPLNSIAPFKDIKFNELISVRQFLQKLGTEAMRNGLYDNVWINSLFSSYTKNSCWIITDCRFKNELAAIKEKKGLTIRITSSYIKYSDGSYRAKSKMMGDHENEHISETDLDNSKFNYIIENNSTLEELTKKIKEILITEKIIII